MTITHIIPARKKDLGGFSVRRLLPYAKQRMVGPWIFFDHIGPVNFPAGEGINVRPHPHINLATVTYLFDGEILHRDSLGNTQAIRPGDINLMVAGSGIAHSERETDEVHNQPHSLHGLQLWHALPKDAEETEPSFTHYSAQGIPSVSVNGVAVRVMMGEAYGATSPVTTFGETLYAEARLQEGDTLTLPDAEELALYIVHGSLSLGGSPALKAQQMAILESGKSYSATAHEETLLVMIGGAPLGERYIEWNFVSSRKARIEQAKQDWKQGKFPKVPGDEKEFIPLPE